MVKNILVSKYIIVDTKYGKCRVRENRYKNNGISTIVTAVDKTSYFINKLKEVWGDYYDYSEVSYIGARTPVLISDKYGKYLSTPSNLLKGKKPRQTSCLDLKQFLKNKSISKWGRGVFNYDGCTYEVGGKITNLFCNKHRKYFNTKYSYHMSSGGCSECSANNRSKSKSLDPPGWRKRDWYRKAKNSKSFDSYKVYMIECWDKEKEERFIKIGRTFQKIKRRFHSKKDLPYKYKLIKTVERVDRNSYEDMEYIYDLENRFKRLYKGYRYAPEKGDFPGKYECFRI